MRSARSLEHRSARIDTAGDVLRRLRLGLARLGATSALRCLFRCQGEPQVVVADVHEFAQALDQSQRHQNIGQRSYANPRIALLKTGDRAERDASAWRRGARTAGRAARDVVGFPPVAAKSIGFGRPSSVFPEPAAPTAPAGLYLVRQTRPLRAR